MSRNYLLVSFDKFDLALCLHLFIAAAFVPAYRLLGCSIVVKELYGFVIAKFWTLCVIFLWPCFRILTRVAVFSIILSLEYLSFK